MRLADIGLKIIEDFKQNDKKSHTSESGTLTLAIRRSWKYSDELNAQAKALKEKKRDEEADGIAEVKEKEHLTFKGIKQLSTGQNWTEIDK